MKVFLVVVSVLIFFTGTSQIQKNNPGIYLSSDDFLDKKLSYQKQDGKRYKLHLHENSHKAIIGIQIGDSLFELKKDSAYGFVDKHAVAYRIYKQELYKILNPTEAILIYSREHLGGYKGTQTITEYYFSKNASSLIYSLTKHNLKWVFSDQIKFKEFIDYAFQIDEDLIAFDEAAGVFKINTIAKKISNN